MPRCLSIVGKCGGNCTKQILAENVSDLINSSWKQTSWRRVTTWGFLPVINKASYEQEEQARSLKYIFLKSYIKLLH